MRNASPSTHRTAQRTITGCRGCGEPLQAAGDVVGRPAPHISRLLTHPGGNGGWQHGNLVEPCLRGERRPDDVHPIVVDQLL